MKSPKTRQKPTKQRKMSETRRKLAKKRVLSVAIARQILSLKPARNRPDPQALMRSYFVHDEGLSEAQAARKTREIFAQIKRNV